MFRKTVSILLVILMAACLTAAAPASASGETFQDKVNAMELEPLKPSYWNQSFIKRVEDSVNGKTSNYEKLVAVYNYIRTNATDKELLGDAPSWYNKQLQCALEVIGFRTYQVDGEWSAVDGWSHAWVGIDIGNNLYYFDAGLPVLQGVEANKCFAISYQNAPLYKNAYIGQAEIEPIITKKGYVKLGLAFADGIPNSVAKRTPYRSVPDKCHPPSLYYEPDGVYWSLVLFLPLLFFFGQLHYTHNQDQLYQQ